MTYLSGRADKRRRNIKYAAFAAFFLLLVIFWALLKKTLYPVLAPGVVQYANVKSSFDIFPEFFRTYLISHKSLIQKEKELELTVERLENELALKEGLLKEQSVRIFGTTTESRTSPPVVMYPLMQDSLSIYSTILLSKGFEDGIEIGDVIFVRGKQVVCTIKEVYTSTSLCLLLTASGVVTEGVTASSSLVLSLTGRGGHFIADVVRDTPILVGEKIYLRSDPTMVLGEVTEVANNNQDTSWHVFVKGAYNPVTTSLFYVQQ